MTLTCATANPGKLREFELAACEFGIWLQPLASYSELPPCQESGATFEENAVLKALHYAPHAAGLLFADDSGLEVDALHGEPGVRSARFAGENATDADNNRLLLDRMRGEAQRAARFVCAIALADGSRLLRTFRGVVEGRLLDEPRGTGGFGYDPLFYYPPFGCTFAEAPRERKMLVSHRGHALTAMFQWLASQP